MKKLVAIYFFLLLLRVDYAADLKQSKFTQVINDVEVISAKDNSKKPAAVNDLFNRPDLVRTGAASRAELVAEDRTITRVGANTVFSFDPANRTIDLQQGSLLFHSPKGKGGGTIRTTSATAAVLGTTLIVTTTHRGGFKVIDLEGRVAIAYAGGLRENLNPGQMTFVLPGGRPAPILNVRLDTLTKDSHLVQGFAHPLPSLPLIEQQVAKQVKMIQSGQAQDTGLLVGDDATATSVQTVQVDPNIISAVTTESAGPVAIDLPTLETSFISSGLGGVAFTAPDDRPDMVINTSTIDLSPYAGTPSFTFLAPDSITMNGSVLFGGFPANSTSAVSLVAGNQLSIAAGSTVEADVGHFSLFAGGPNGMALNGVQILNQDPTGTITLVAPSSLSLGNGCSLQAQNSLSLSSDNDITLTGSSLVAANSVSIDSVNGNVTLNSPELVSTSSLDVTAGGSISAFDSGGGGGGGGGSHFQVGNVTLNAGDGILLSGNTQNPMAGSAPLLFKFAMSAANSIQIQNMDFGGYATINLTAHTINLSNIDFENGSVVNLTSHFGVLNVGSSVVGDVNFINNVTYGGPGQPAQNHIVPLTSTGPGITIDSGAP